MSNKEVALQIISFLKQAAANKEVSDDYLESVDVAVDCIADAFEVDKDDSTTVKTIFKGKDLKEILNEFKEKNEISSAATEGVEVPVHIDEDEETAKKAEALKLEGNKAMAAKDFEGAVSKYTEALSLTPKNAVYLSNRAAAYSSLREHEKAIEDAKTAIEIDPSYAKAYSRLGLASYALNKPKDALEAYKKGLDAEGDKPTDAMRKGYETAKKRVEEQLDSASAGTATTRDASSTGSAGANTSGMPDLSNLASMFGGGAGGGAPNFGDFLNNPQLMQTAQQMLSNPGALQNLMSNPAIQQMAQQFGLGGESGSGSESGSTPDLSSLLNNPALQNLANGFGNSGGNNSNNNNNAGTN